MNLEQKIIEIVKGNMQNQKEVSVNSHLVNDLELGSFDRLMIVNSVEDEFAITIEDKDIDSLKTIQDICNILRANYNLK